MSTIVDNNYNKNILIGSILGAGACSLAASKGFSSVFGNVEKNEGFKIKKAVEKVLKKTGLKQNGFCIENITDIKQVQTKLPDFLNPYTQIVKGKNASFDHFDKSIIINMKKLPLAVFHEIGHAHNYLKSPILRRIQKLKPFLFLASMAVAFSPLLLDRTLAWKENERNTAEKLKDSLLDNTPTIAAASYIPILTEEGIASFKAGKLAKPLLNPKLYSKMVKGNVLGFSTYLLELVSIALTAKALQQSSTK